MKKIVLLVITTILIQVSFLGFGQTKSSTTSTTCSITAQSNKDNSRTFTSVNAAGKVVGIVTLSEVDRKIRINAQNFSDTPKSVNFSGDGYPSFKFTIPANGTLVDDLTPPAGVPLVWGALLIVALCVETGYNQCDGFFL